MITCTRPGLIRGGVRHPKSAQHKLEAFTPAQLREMLAEPELHLTLGRPLLAGDVDAIEASAKAAPAEKPEGAKTPKAKASA